MRMRAQFMPVCFLTIACAIPVYAQGGGSRGPGGGGGNGNKPPVEVTTNLSYPAMFYGNPQQSGIIGSYTLAGKFPSGMSYGCLIPETIGTTTYPNTSCIDTQGNPESYETCVARCTQLDPAVSVERIYWEKNASNKWQAGYMSAGSSPLPVSYIDWGDNLESKTWPVQVLRVETNTFSALPAYDANAAIVNNPGVRFDMWHVSGQGTDELWGVHATNADPPVPYVYFADAENSVLYWPYAVDNSSDVRLNLAKLEAGQSVCPATPGGSGANFNGSWVLENRAWTGAAYTRDMAYGAELNIKGSYVYGYNWNLVSEPMPAGVDRAGWWRLTFYTPSNSIDFNTWVDPETAGVNTLAPPAPEAYTGLFPVASPLSPLSPPLSGPDRLQDRMRLGQQVALGGILPAAETGGMLYVPQVDKGANLTYLDICISASKGGSGSNKGRKGN